MTGRPIGFQAPRKPGAGACTCTPGTLYPQCTCDWGRMLDELMRLGYRADQLDIGADAQAVADQAMTTIRKARAVALQTVWSGWKGSMNELADRIGVARGRIYKLMEGAK